MYSVLSVITLFATLRPSSADSSCSADHELLQRNRIRKLEIRNESSGEGAEQAVARRTVWCWAVACLFFHGADPPFGHGGILLFPDCWS